MNKEQKRKASVDLTLTYLSNYYADWRLAKVLTIEKLLKERYGFYESIIHEVKDNRDADGSATIAQEIKHGLYFDAIAHCVQYVEDLFALIKSAKQPDYFIKNIITYKAGEITTFIKSFKINSKIASEIYHFPHELQFQEQEKKSVFDEGVKNLITLTEEIISFYKGYEFFYNQYKHGLSVAMRPFGNIYDTERIEKDKTGELNPYIVVYDNLNFEAASKKGTFNLNHGVIIPGFTENVRPFLNELSKENNLIRFVHTPDYPDFSIQVLVDCARKTRACIQTFITNYSRSINANDKDILFQLPVDYAKNSYYVISVSYKEEDQNQI